MRALQIQFHPELVRISAEEILADLQYPVAPSRPEGARKPAPARRRNRR